MAKDKGTYRSTNTVLLDSPDFKDLSRTGRHLLLTLKNTRLTNMAHIFYCGRGELFTLEEQTSMDNAELMATLAELIKKRWVVYLDNILWIRNGLRFEPGYNHNNKNHRAAVQNIINGLPKSDVVAMFCRYYNESVFHESSFSIPFEYHSDSKSILLEDYFDGNSIVDRYYSDGIRIQEQEQEQDTSLTFSDEKVEPEGSTPNEKYSEKENDRRWNAGEVAKELKGYPGVTDKNTYQVAEKLRKIFEADTPESDVDIIRYIIVHCKKYVCDKGFKTAGQVYGYFTSLCQQEVAKGNWGNIISKAHKWADNNQPRDGPEKIGQIFNQIANKAGG